MIVSGGGSHVSSIERMFGRRVAMLGVLACLAGYACSAPQPGPPPQPAPPQPSWTEVHLPDAPAEVIIGDLVRCTDRWYAAGGLQDAAGATRPAVWSSAAGRGWQRVPVAPVSAYGRQQVLFSLACRDGGLAAVGATSGGVHGVLRISSWRSDADGALTEVVAPSELYGGPRALTVEAIAGLPSGWLITGNRVGPTGLATAAVWLSPDGSGFVPRPDALGLTSCSQGDTTARGVVAGRSDWFVFGDVRPPGSIARQPAVWGSTGGLVWARATMPPAQGDASVTAMAVDGGLMLAMGTLDGSLHAWSYDGSTWSNAGGFPASDRSGAGLATVGSVTLTGRDAYAAADDGIRWALWRSTDLLGWQPVQAPAQPANGADNRLLLAGSNDLLVVAETLRTGSRLWIAPRTR